VADHNHVSSPNLCGVDRFASEQKKVEKPWGHELIFAVTDRYAGKLLHVKAGEALSLQFHNVKDESWYILEGRVELELGAPGQGVLSSEVVGAGASFRLEPGTVHRLRAIEDTTIVEVSTPELDDVVRLEDVYGREGTSEP
jgi:mannose-6-phosphate isomerase